MDYKWYIDTYWIGICLVDLVAFVLAAHVLGKTVKVRKCLLLSVLSATAETFFFLVNGHYAVYRLLVLAVVNPLLTLGLLWPCKKELLLKGYLVITGSILFAGGLQTMFLYWIPFERGVWLWQILLAVIGAFLCLWHKRSSRYQQHIYEVELTIKGETVVLQACHDTGNFLRDPFTGKPVSIMEMSALGELLKIVEGGVNLQGEKPRYIPFHTVGQEHGLLPVFTIEKMIIRQGTKEIERIQPVIGLSEKELFLQKDIQMILHSQML